MLVANLLEIVNQGNCLLSPLPNFIRCYWNGLGFDSFALADWIAGRTDAKIGYSSMKTSTANSPRITVAEVERLVRSLTAVEKTNVGIEVTVPVAYGDGELVTVVVEHTKDALVVHDASFSAMRLSNAGVSFTPNVVHRLAELAARYGCAFHDGRVGSSAESIEALPHVVALVANAARSVADYAFEIKRAWAPGW